MFSLFFRSESSSTSPLQMTLLDGGGGGGSAEVTTLSRPAFHRNGTSNAKKLQANFGSDVNANNISNGTFTSTESSRRVPEIAAQQNNENRENGGSESQQHDLKKWSEMCKMSSPTFKRPESAENGDSNNNHANNTDSSSSQVLPEMDFSN